MKTQDVQLPSGHNNKSKDFSFGFESSKSPREIFEILLDVRTWWTGIYSEKIVGTSSRLQEAFTFSAAGGAHITTQRLIESIPGKRIAWLVVESNLSFLENPAEWAGTKICFDISSKGAKSQVQFTHVGLVPGLEAYDGCSAGWTEYLHKLEERLA